jgi:S1-C subfamily serine protease
MVKIRLEPGDKITGIDGYQVTNLQELIVAVNSAGDPHRLDIAFIDWRSGNEYVGTINAMRVK